jgi:hypothetical protein
MWSPQQRAQSTAGNPLTRVVGQPEEVAAVILGSRRR